MAPDRHFSLPRLAAVYDALDPDRADLIVYAEILGELGARSVIDIGCGTGTFAIMLAEGGTDVVGVDPAEASLAVARSKQGADRVQWVCADARSLPAVPADAVTMTGNVAQVFLDDAQWADVLRAARRALRPGAHLVFETRDPAARDWQHWTRESSFRTARTHEGTVASWIDVGEVTATTVSFTTTFAFSDGEVLVSDSTLKFRQRDELRASLHAAGFGEAQIRDAPDRPGLELVFIAPR